MNIYPVQMSNCAVKSPNFGAKFLHNQISKDLMNSASEEDVIEFKNACNSLQNAKRDQYCYLLTGVTSGYGVCSETEIDDKFVDLSYKESQNGLPSFLQSWMIRGEDVVSGGYEKKNLLKEITKSLKKIAEENAVHTKYNPVKTIVKKATYVGKVI